MAVRMLRLSCISASSLHSVRIASHCCCTLGSHSFALLLHLITQTHARALRLAPGTHGRRCYPSELPRTPCMRSPPNPQKAKFVEILECELPRIPKRRSSQNSYSTHFGE